MLDLKLKEVSLRIPKGVWLSKLSIKLARGGPEWEQGTYFWCWTSPGICLMRLVISPTDMNSANKKKQGWLLQDQEYPYLLLYLILSLNVLFFHLCFRLLLIHVCFLKTIWETYAIKLALNCRLWIPWHFNSFKRSNSLGLQLGESLMQISVYGHSDYIICAT